MEPNDETIDTPPTGEEGQKAAAPKSPPWLTPNLEEGLENFNLVPLLEKDPEGKQWLADFADRILKEKKEDEDSMAPYLERIAWSIRLFMSRNETFASGPAKGERKPVLPVLAKIANRIYARTVSAAQLATPIAVPSGDEDNDRAIRVGKHMAWEIRKKHPEWKPAMQASVLQWILAGWMARYVGWDPVERKKRIEWMSAGELFMPYDAKDVTPDLREVERMTRVKDFPKWRLFAYEREGHFHGVSAMFSDTEKKPTSANKLQGTENPLTAVQRDVMGIEPSSTRKSSVYRTLERYSWEELPGSEKGDYRRICAVMEESTKRVLRLVIMEREDPSDRLRYDNEISFAKARMNSFVAEMQAKAQSGAPPEMLQTMKPPAETEVEKIAPPKTEVIYPIIQYPFMPNPEGSYGLGVWVFVGGLNEIANELAGEDIVAQRLANVSGQTGFIDEDAQIEKGDISLEYGAYTKVATNGKAINQVVSPLQFGRPTGQMMSWVDKVDQEAQAVMSSSDAQSGMPGPDRETAAAAKLRAYNGQTAISAAVESFMVPLAAEFKLYALMNSLHMPDVEGFLVEEPDPANPAKTVPVIMKIGREDYAEDFDITWDSDSRLEVDPGLGQSAIDAYQMLMADPELQAPDFATLRMRARKKVLRALKCPELAAMLPDEVPPPPPPSPMSQQDETAGFMEEQDHPVLEDDDDLDHIARMEEVKTLGMYDQMTPTAKQLFDRHLNAHRAQAYRKGSAIATQNQQGGMNAEGAPQPGPPGLA